MSIESQALIDTITLTSLSSRGPECKAKEEVMPLSEYKFDRNRLAMVKRTLKQKRALIGGIEKVVIEGFEESMLWDVSGLDMSQVGVETSVVIVKMALVRQSSLEAMAK